MMHDEFLTVVAIISGLSIAAIIGIAAVFIDEWMARRKPDGQRSDI